jgi:DNA-binding XRE family transcriptional regulator
MELERQRALEAKGWKVGTVDEFLGVPPERARVIQTKVALAVCLKRHRKAKKLTQTKLAKRIGSSQSRVVKIEQADSSVSFELLLRALLAAGVSPAKIGAVIATANPDAVPMSVEVVRIPTRAGEAPTPA